MNPIDKEIEKLLLCARSGELPGFTDNSGAASFYCENSTCDGVKEYFSGENDALEAQLQALWKDDPQLLRCIPVIIAAVEKSRGRDAHALSPAELYNYTM